MHKLDELLKQSGVKGMKWGVRHDDRPAKGPEKGKIGKHVDSLKRERQWKQAVKQVHTMSTKDINTVKKRIDLENELKVQSKSKMATKKDKEDYLRRHEMANDELSRKVTRLKAKNALYESVRAASKEQREFGIKLAQTGSSIALKLATKQKLGPEDLINLYKNPVIKTKQNALDEALNLADGKANNPKVKNAISLARNIKFKEAKGGKSKG